FSLMLCPPPPLTLFPYTTLFRSRAWTEAAIFFLLIAEPPGRAALRARRGNAAHAEGVSRHPAAAGGARAGAPREPRPCPACSGRSEEHTSELQSLRHLVCRLLLE